MSEAATTDVYKTAEGGWRVADSRVSLDSVVYAFRDGRSAEEIAVEFPALTVQQVCAAIAFYLRNQREIDAHLSQQEAKWVELAEGSERQHDRLLNRLRNGRESDAEE
jgi:uncharacterized protein (DUF433 family)